MKKILIVDDLLTILDVLKEELEDNNYSVDIAASYDITIEKINKNTYDLIVLDIALPNPLPGGDDYLTGIHLFEIINKLRPKPKVIVYTTNSRRYEENVILMAADQIVVKSHDLKNLISCIAEVLKGNQCDGNN